LSFIQVNTVYIKYTVIQQHHK